MSCINENSKKGKDMAYQLNEEQNMIQAMVRDLAREVILPTAAERDKTGEFPADNIRKMGELGLMGMNLPPEYNGAGVVTALTVQDTAKVHQVLPAFPSVVRDQLRTLLRDLTPDAVKLGMLRQVTSHQGRPALHGLGQAADDHARWQGQLER